MSKKSFKDSTSHLDRFFSDERETQEDAQEVAHDDAHEVAQEVKPRAKTPKRSKPLSAPAPEVRPQRPYVRTQGRKGQKKPRINLAFDSEDFLEEIRDRAERDGLSITQLVNGAVAYYLDSTK